MFHSLSARLFAILTVGLGAIQIISFVAFMTFRGQEIKQQISLFLGADVAFAYEFMRALPAEQRMEWLARLNQGFHYRFSLEAINDSPAPEALPEDDRLKKLTAVLSANLPTEAKLSFRLPTGVDPSLWEKALQVVLVIDENQALVLHLLDPFTMPSAYSLFLYLGIALLAVIPFVGWAVHLTTRHIDSTLTTIEQFGQNLNSPPVPESGPDELQKAARAVNTMRESILKFIEERTQILAAIAHDLQTPLTRLRLCAEGLQTGAQRERIINEIEYMASLVMEGLDYARSSHILEGKSIIQINHWLEGMVDATQDSGTACALKGQAKKPFTGSLRALTRAMQNLIENALKFGTQVEVCIEDSDERLIVRVLDNGPGLTDALMEKVFEPFFRAESSRNRETGGSGLGLAIARNIIRAHGGDIHLKNGKTGGLEAVVELPRDG